MIGELSSGIIGLYAFLAVVVVVLVWLGGTFNGLVRLRQHVRESFSGIDTELKRRYDLIPNLVETVRGYAKHERQTLDAVIEARTRAVQSTGSAQSQALDENQLVSALRGLFAIVEGYPQLKASDHFLQLQNELANTEDRIQAARRFYNANIRDLNTRVEVFPSNIVARMFGFAREPFFQVESCNIRRPVKVNLPGNPGQTS